MKYGICFAGAVAILAFGLIVQTASGGDKQLSGKYLIYAADKQIQTDAYQVSPDGVSLDIIKSAGSDDVRKIEISTNAKNPLSDYYRESVNGVQKSSAAVEKDYIWFYEGEAKMGALAIEPDIRFFDPTAFANFTMLMRKFLADGNTSEAISVVVPALQDYCEIELQRHGSDAMTAGEKSFTAAHYRMTLGKREVVNFWVDGERIIGIHMASKGVIAVDEAYPNLLKEVKQAMGKSS